MAAKLDEIRKAADRVAGSLGLDVVDVEFTGAAKSRVLCIYLEKDAAGRTRQAAAALAQREAIAARADNGADGEFDPDLDDAALTVPARFTTGELNPEHLSWLTHEDCAAFSRDFGVLLDVEDLVPDGEYTLEVSSPGVDRKLTKPEEFARFQGSLLKLHTVEAISGNNAWQGRLTASNQDGITLDLTAVKQNNKARKAGVGTIDVPLSNIDKAHVVPEF
jgi:ribosome maturation factor RimP